jgi:hypothetical protein
MTMPEPSAPVHVPADALIAGLDRLRAGSYRGQDRDRLVTVTVDGDGLVLRVVFADTIGSRERKVVEQAVQAAVRAAQQRLIAAYQKLAATGIVDDDTSDSTVDGLVAPSDVLPDASLPNGPLSSRIGEQR